MVTRVIKKIIRNKKNEQLTLTIPKDSGYHAGQFVEVFPVPDQDIEKLRKKFEKKEVKENE